MRTALVLFLLVLAAPGAALGFEPSAPVALRLTLSAAAAAEASGQPVHDDELAFDLLGPPASAEAADAGRLKLRRRMLTLHQGLGLGLLASTAALTVVGQFNYSDRFAGGPSTGRFEQPHAILAFTTLGLFATTGLAAILAPVPVKHSQGLDRATLHKIGMFTATAGMAAQAGLGLWTAAREGHVNQPQLATAHLVVGYVTFAAMALGVGAMTF